MANPGCDEGSERRVVRKDVLNIDCLIVCCVVGWFVCCVVVCCCCCCGCICMVLVGGAS